MVKFVLIDKTGNCKDSNIGDLDNIYKRCGIRNEKDFENYKNHEEKRRSIGSRTEGSR